jgi:hypothetical protein
MADAAGFENPADTTVVSEGIINALEAGDFHLFPDEMAKQIEAAYQSFSDNVIMVDSRITSRTRKGFTLKHLLKSI